MPGVAPLIGIPGYVKPITMARDLREPALVAPLRYVDAVALAGGIPVVLPYGEARAVLERIDGIVLMGGGDIDPSTYGAEPGPQTAGVDADRDGFEIALVKGAVERGIPTLAICRGCQVANVALGGTLVRHLDGHRSAPGIGLLHGHLAEAGSRVEKACGESFDAWSSHHQAIEAVAPGLQVTARAPDGTIEAVEFADRWLVAVQWHPERTAAEDPKQLALFDALVREALDV